MGQTKYEALETHNLTTCSLCSQEVRPPDFCSQAAGKGADAKAALPFCGFPLWAQRWLCQQASLWWQPANRLRPPA